MINLYSKSVPNNRKKYTNLNLFYILRQIMRFYFPEFIISKGFFPLI